MHGCVCSLSLLLLHLFRLLSTAMMTTSTTTTSTKSTTRAAKQPTMGAMRTVLDTTPSAAELTTGKEGMLVVVLGCEGGTFSGSPVGHGDTSPSVVLHRGGNVGTVTSLGGKDGEEDTPLRLVCEGGMFRDGSPVGINDSAVLLRGGNVGKVASLGGKDGDCTIFDNVVISFAGR